MNILIHEDIYRLINEKKLELECLKEEKNSILKSYNKESSTFIEKLRLTSLIDLNAKQVSYLKDELKSKIDKVNDDKEKLKEINKRLLQRVEAIRLHKEKIHKIKEMYKKSEKFLYNKLNDHDNMKLAIVEFEKKRLKELNVYVFNLTEINPKLEEDLAKSTFTALKDARMTMYINGRWILSNDQLHYTIVKSKLPSTGDYSAYYKNSLDNDGRDEKKLSHEQHHMPVATRNSTHNEIEASLTYTTQFVNLIAFYLNAVLPYNLPHNKFCSQYLNEVQFTNAVAKLNVNIIYLCLHQRVPVNNLLPKHTLENLYHFCNYFKEMKVKTRDKHAIIFPTDVIALLEEMFVKCGENDDLDFIPNIPLNDYEEWETLPNSDEIPMDVAVPVTSPSNTRSGLFASSTSLISSVTQFLTRRLTNN